MVSRCDQALPVRGLVLISPRMDLSLQKRSTILKQTHKAFTMKIDFDYEAPEESSLLRYLLTGLQAISHDYDPIKDLPPHRVIFHGRFDDGVEVNSQMHDLLGEWTEVGILRFRCAPKNSKLENWVSLDQSFDRKLSATKLVIKEEGLYAASGLVLRADSGIEITLVAGALPYSLAITGPGLSGGRALFSPEYDIEKYIRVSMEVF
jgi:hypothetical protein